jgi:hypothetical protein
MQVWKMEMECKKTKYSMLFGPIRNILLFFTSEVVAISSFEPLLQVF